MYSMTTPSVSKFGESVRASLPFFSRRQHAHNNNHLLRTTFEMVHPPLQDMVVQAVAASLPMKTVACCSMDAGMGEWWVEVRNKNACRVCPPFSGHIYCRQKKDGMFLKSMLLVNGTSLSVGFIFVLCGSLWREDCSQDTQSFDHFPSFSTLNICDNRWQLRRRISHNTSFTLHWTKSPFTTWKQGDFDSSLEIKRVFAWSCSMEIIDSWFILANPEKMPHLLQFFTFQCAPLIPFSGWLGVISHPISPDHIFPHLQGEGTADCHKNPGSLGFCVDDACTIASFIQLSACYGTFHQTPSGILLIWWICHGTN